jgi:lysophospholipase L1-like esterase
MRWASLAALALALLALNAGLVGFVHWSGLDSAPVDVQTRALYELRLQRLGAEQDRRKVVFIGDSLIRGANLVESEGEAWAERTLPARFGARLEALHPGRFEVLNLGINGLLPRDADRIVADVLLAAPALLVLNVTPRSFAADFDSEQESSARPFLHEDEGRPALQSVGAALGRGLRRLLPILRYRDLLQFHYLGKTPADAVEALVVDALAGPADEEDDLLEREILPLMKAARRYNSVAVGPGHLQAKHLASLLARLQAPGAPPALLLGLAEDVEALGDQLDLKHYRAQSVALRALVRGQIPAPGRVRFVEVGAKEVDGEYADHIHLTAAGYDLLAARLLREAGPLLEAHARD